MRKRTIAVSSLAAVAAAVFINPWGSDDAPEKVEALPEPDQKAEVVYNPFAVVAGDKWPENEVSTTEALVAEEIEKGVIIDVGGDRYAVWDRLHQAEQDGDLEEVLFYEIINAQNIGDEAWHLLLVYARQNDIQQPLLNIKDDLENYLVNMSEHDLEELSSLYLAAFDFNISVDTIMQQLESAEAYNKLVAFYKSQVPDDDVENSDLSLEELNLRGTLARLEGEGVDINHDAFPQVEEAWKLSNEGLAFGDHIAKERVRFYGENVTHTASEEELNSFGGDLSF